MAFNPRRHGAMNLLSGAVILLSYVCAAGSAFAGAATGVASATAAIPPRDRQVKPDARPRAAESRPAATAAETKPEAKADTPEVELFVPSVTRLADAAKRSKTATIYRALSGLLRVPENETDEGVDIRAVFSILEQVQSWPDASVAATTYSQDADGRPRWAVRVDWPLEDVRQRVQDLIDSEAGAKLLKGLVLRDSAGGGCELELDDVRLGVLKPASSGTLIASSDALSPPERVFGEPRDDGRSQRTPAYLVYCLLNIKDSEGDSVFNYLSGIRDARYGLTLTDDGLWNEKFSMRWNPLIGIGVKMYLQRIDAPFELPRDSYVLAAFNLGMGGELVDSLAGLPPATIGARAGNDMAFVAAPGSGFLPFPDAFFVFNAKRPKRIIEAVRKAVGEENKKQRDEDLPPSWHEETVAGQIVFWNDPTSGGGGGISPVTYRTVLFFDGYDPKSDARSAKLVVGQSSTSAADAVANWNRLGKRRVTVPDDDEAHWLGRIRWKHLYAFGQPYLALLAGFTEGAELPPSTDEIGDALADSRIEVRVQFTGFEVRHTGPIPLGAAYVPAVAASSLGAAADPSSEAAREQVACRHLRVLHHQAKLFRKDYDRWPATVAELEGYIDFQSHPELLQLRPPDRGVLGNIATRVLTAGKPASETDADDAAPDDSLYEIAWSPDDWRLQFRADQFKNYRTIYIDAEGEIHRVPKESKSEAAKATE